MSSGVIAPGPLLVVEINVCLVLLLDDYRN